MKLDLSAEQDMLRDSVARLAARDFAFAERRAAGLTGADADKAWQAFAEMGLQAATVPEELGGLSGGGVETVVIMEEFGRGSVREPLIGGALLSAALLRACPQGAARDELLGDIAVGGRICAALYEPQGNGDHFDVRTTVHGDHLTGTKILVSGAVAGGRALVSARNDAGDIELHAIALAGPGVGLTPYALFDGSVVHEVTLDDAASLATLSVGDAASNGLDAGIDHAVLALCAEVVGCMARATDLTAQYVKVRQQFGQPISSFQVTQHRIADMFMRTEAARSALFAPLSKLSGDPRERSAAVSGCFVEVTENAREVTGLAIHQHGGIGMTLEFEVGHHYRRARVAAQLFGDIDFHTDRYLRLGQPVSG